MDESEVPFPETDRIVLDIDHFDVLARQVGNVLKKRQQTTAFFIHDDYLAGHVIQALRQMGIGVPADISIIAPGDVLSYDEPFIPRITTMKINTAVMGELAARTAISIINKRVEDIQVLKVKEQLVDRGSCRALF